MLINNDSMETMYQQTATNILKSFLCRIQSIHPIWVRCAAGIFQRIVCSVPRFRHLVICSVNWGSAICGQFKSLKGIQFERRRKQLSRHKCDNPAKWGKLPLTTDYCYRFSQLCTKIYCTFSLKIIIMITRTSGDKTVVSWKTDFDNVLNCGLTIGQWPTCLPSLTPTLSFQHQRGQNCGWGIF